MMHTSESSSYVIEQKVFFQCTKAKYVMPRSYVCNRAYNASYDRKLKANRGLIFHSLLTLMLAPVTYVIAYVRNEMKRTYLKV